MNAIDTELGRKAHAETLARLLKEYGEKLASIARDLLEWQDRLTMGPRAHDISSLTLQLHLDRWGAIGPHVERLTRAASQALDHLELDVIQELELKLRIDEVEQALDAVGQAVKLVLARNPKLTIRRTGDPANPVRAGA